MNIPNKLYHATTQKNAMSIMISNLKPLGVDHLIYFANSFGGASTFAYMHGIPLEDIVVIVVDTTKLDKDLFDYGYDHSVSFFKNIEVYTYPIEISTKHICNYMQIDLDSLERR